MPRAALALWPRPKPTFAGECWTSTRANAPPGCELRQRARCARRRVGVGAVVLDRGRARPGSGRLLGEAREQLLEQAEVGPVGDDADVNFAHGSPSFSRIRRTTDGSTSNASRMSISRRFSSTRSATLAFSASTSCSSFCAQARVAAMSLSSFATHGLASASAPWHVRARRRASRALGERRTRRDSRRAAARARRRRPRRPDAGGSAETRVQEHRCRGTWRRGSGCARRRRGAMARFYAAPTRLRPPADHSAASSAAASARAEPGGQPPAAAMTGDALAQRTFVGNDHRQARRPHFRQRVAEALRQPVREQHAVSTRYAASQPASASSSYGPWMYNSPGTTHPRVICVSV